MMEDKVRYYATVGAVLAVIIWAAAYMILWNSDGYIYAMSFLRANPKVIAYIGPVKSSRPQFLHFKERYVHGLWDEQYHVKLTGTYRSVDVYIHTQNSAFACTILEASMNTDDGPMNLDPDKPTSN